MTLSQLKIFEAVARHLNVTRAAEEIRISQPSISKQLRLLENEFGVKFHLRTGQGIKLTERGRMFKEGVGSILRQIDKLKKTMTNIVDKDKTRTFIVGGTQSPSASLLPRVLKTFRQRHPTLRPVLRTSDSETVERMVLKAQVEIALITNPSGHSQIVSQPLRSERVIAVVSARHPLAKKGRLTPEELTRAPFVIRTGGRIVKQIEQKGLKLNVVMQCESSEVLKSAIQSGVGIGLLYWDIAEPGLRGGLLKDIEIPGLKNIDAKCFIIYRKDVPLSSDAQDFLALLRGGLRRRTASVVSKN